MNLCVKKRLLVATLTYLYNLYDPYSNFSRSTFFCALYIPVLQIRVVYQVYEDMETHTRFFYCGSVLHCVLLQSAVWFL